MVCCLSYSTSYLVICDILLVYKILGIHNNVYCFSRVRSKKINSTVQKTFYYFCITGCHNRHRHGTGKDSCKNKCC